MSYRCELCRRVVPPKKALLRHTTYRVRGGRLVTLHDGSTASKTDLEIDREYAVCQRCKTRLDGGVPPEVVADPRPLDGRETVVTTVLVPVAAPRAFSGGKRL